MDSTPEELKLIKHQTSNINITMSEDAAATTYYNQGSEEVAKETPLTLKKLEKVSEPQPLSFLV
jgi:hypothetical protein